MHDVTTADVSAQTRLQRLRAEYPVFRIEDARATRTPAGVTLEFAFAAGGLRFQPVVELTGLSEDETAAVITPTARRMIRALAIIEAFSYWKALCSPVIEIALPAPDPPDAPGTAAPEARSR